MIIEEIKKIKSGTVELRNFGITLGIALGVLGGLFLWREKAYYIYFFIIAAPFLLLAFTVPVLLKPFHKVWMTLSILMGWVMTRIILIILFYGILTPIGVIARLCGKDFLDKKIDKNAKSYWVVRTSAACDKKSYEHQF
jgi:hypothetical protein